MGGALGQSSLAMCRSRRDRGSGRKKVWRHVRTGGYHFYHNTKAYATSYLSYNSNIIMKGLSFELLMSLIHLHAGLHS